jgi:hypothetical protein
MSPTPPVLTEVISGTIAMQFFTEFIRAPWQRQTEHQRNPRLRLFVSHSDPSEAPRHQHAERVAKGPGLCRFEGHSNLDLRRQLRQAPAMPPISLMVRAA